MRHTPSLSLRVYFPLYSWRPHRYYFSKFFPRHCLTRHLLCSSSFPLRPVNRSRIRHCCWVRPLIPLIYRLHPARHLNKNSLWYYVCRSQPHLLPPTFPWPCWHATTIFRLPRCLHPMKYSFLYRLTSFPSGSHPFPIHHLRGLRCQT